MRPGWFAGNSVYRQLVAMAGYSVAPEMSFQLEPGQQVGFREMKNPQCRVLGPVLRRIRHRPLCQSENLVSEPPRYPNDGCSSGKDCQLIQQTAALSSWHLFSNQKGALQASPQAALPPLEHFVVRNSGVPRLPSCAPAWSNMKMDPAIVRPSSSLQGGALAEPGHNYVSKTTRPLRITKDEDNLAQ